MVPTERRHGVSPADAYVLIVRDVPSRPTAAIIVLVAVIEIIQPVVNIEIQAVTVTALTEKEVFPFQMGPSRCSLSLSMLTPKLP